MDLPEYKGYLVEAIAAEAGKASESSARETFEALAERLRGMDAHDKYLEDAWREHGELPDEARRDALRTALAAYRAHDKAERLPTVFLIDLFHAARPQEGFV